MTVSATPLRELRSKQPYTASSKAYAQMEEMRRAMTKENAAVASGAACELGAKARAVSGSSRKN